MKIEIARGGEAHALLMEPGFLDDWSALHRLCPWATAFQSVAFLRTWYATYRDAFEPIVVFGRGGPAGLDGLLALARDRDSGRIAPAGTHHAEYQVWLARPSAGDAFIEGALRQCADELSLRHLQFLFVPPAAPLAWCSAPGGRLRAIARVLPRGLMAVSDQTAISASLRKKSNRSRLQRLQRLGPVRLERLTTRAALDAVIGPIMAHCDLRQGAVNASTPFRSDGHKREFYLAMMEADGLLHATVLRVGDEVAAAHLGGSDRTCVSLGLITHSPFLAAHSPGKLLILLLGQQLGQEGYRDFDLTPGGSYKDRFATRYDEVHVLDVFFSRAGHARHLARQHLSAGVQRALSTARMDPRGVLEKAAAVGDRLTRVTPLSVPATAWRLARRLAWSRREFRIYRLAVDEIAGDVPRSELRRDALEDLLLYAPCRPSDPPLGAFLHDALARLESGQHVYTRVEDGRLVHYGWLIESTNRASTEFGHELALEEHSAVLWDDYTHPIARGRGWHTASLYRRLRDAAGLPEARYVYIGVRADNGPSRHNIEKVGFRRHRSAWIETRLGRSRRWVVDAEPG